MKLDIPAGDFAGYLFDLDGTLIDTMPLHFAAWRDALRRCGLGRDLDEDFFYSLGGVPTLLVARRIGEHYGVPLDAARVEHVKEEIYLYVDMPAPNFGLHLNYTDPKEMEMVVPVWEGDAVAIKKGYHYNVATPGTQVGFVWMMAAIREGEDRMFGTVTIQPEFAGDRFKLF